MDYRKTTELNQRVHVKGVILHNRQEMCYIWGEVLYLYQQEKKKLDSIVMYETQI